MQHERLRKGDQTSVDGGRLLVLRHGHGDHDVWRSPKVDKPFTVPVKVKSRHAANKIMKDAGLPKAF